MQDPVVRDDGLDALEIFSVGRKGEGAIPGGTSVGGADQAGRAALERREREELLPEREAMNGEEITNPFLEDSGG